jgi:lysine 2,3-aminomutase
VGDRGARVTRERIREGIDYIRENPEIRDVLLTGGDPLLLPDDEVEWILRELYEVPSVEVLRLGSRTPCTLPQRITPELCEMLEQFHPLYLNTQFNHPKEVTPEAEEACRRLASAGIPLGNQTVLLRGINDDGDTMKELVRELMRIRVRPYYLYQCQVLKGTRHFRTAIEKGTEIIGQLQGHTSGLAVPKFVVDTPYGKIPADPKYVQGRVGDDVVLKSFDGHTWREPNPVPDREDAEEKVSGGVPAHCSDCCGCD